MARFGFGKSATYHNGGVEGEEFSSWYSGKFAEHVDGNGGGKGAGSKGQPQDDDADGSGGTRGSGATRGGSGGTRGGTRGGSKGSGGTRGDTGGGSKGSGGTRGTGGTGATGGTRGTGSSRGTRSGTGASGGTNGSGGGSGYGGMDDLPPYTPFPDDQDDDGDKTDGSAPFSFTLDGEVPIDVTVSPWENGAIKVDLSVSQDSELVGDIGRVEFSLADEDTEGGNWLFSPDATETEKNPTEGQPWDGAITFRDASGPDSPFEETYFLVGHNPGDLTPGDFVGQNISVFLENVGTIGGIRDGSTVTSGDVPTPGATGQTQMAGLPMLGEDADWVDSLDDDDMDDEDIFV